MLYFALTYGAGICLHSSTNRKATLNIGCTRMVWLLHTCGVCVYTHTQAHTQPSCKVCELCFLAAHLTVLAVLVLLTDCGTDSHAQGINPSRRSALNKGTCISQQAQRGFTILYSAVHLAGYMWYLSQMITKTNDQIRRKLSSRKYGTIRLIHWNKIPWNIGRSGPNLHLTLINYWVFSYRFLSLGIQLWLVQKIIFFQCQFCAPFILESFRFLT